jgi:uncharacterized repeat protein (TIGR03803 family)
LYSFCAQADCTDGEQPHAGLIADANGNLFGTTPFGGAFGSGTVFEIAKTASGYASTPATLVSFCSLANCAHGVAPYGGLIADANGNLFGTTNVGGAYGAAQGGYGTVFEIAKTASGYANTPTTLVSFNSIDGAYPEDGLIVDAHGNLFGTTPIGGTFGGGTVFEIANTASGYAGTPTTLYSFCAQADCTDGEHPEAGLLADANGNLFGMTPFGGAYGDGTVFKLQTFAGLPGQPTCIGNSVSALDQKYGGLNAAAAALGYSSISAQQRAIMAYCDGSDQVASSLH